LAAPGHQDFPQKAMAMNQILAQNQLFLTKAAAISPDLSHFLIEDLHAGSLRQSKTSEKRPFFAQNAQNKKSPQETQTVIQVLPVATSVVSK